MRTITIASVAMLLAITLSGCAQFGLEAAATEKGLRATTEELAAQIEAGAEEGIDGALVGCEFLDGSTIYGLLTTGANALGVSDLLSGIRERRVEACNELAEDRATPVADVEVVPVAETASEPTS